mmetsp:Transcript_10060/g.14943  ORF Transcript_10060/g.14943 Transcript_10060/m.14943 type:complete len:372 (-) Transcript_10060:1232-2347(-)
MPAPKVRLVSHRKPIHGWPTDSISIDFYKGEADNVDASPSQNKCKPNLILIFIPGNPGLIEWYSDTLVKIVEQLGVGYAVRGISYAGHGAGDDVIGSADDHKHSFVNTNGHQDVVGTKMSVSWTILGQIKHKLSWVDDVIEEWKVEFRTSSQPTAELPRLIFLSHSFGAYLVQHMLLRRPALLQQTQQIIHLMPFIRFDPPPLQKTVLSKLAHSYEYTIPMLSNSVWALTSTLPRKLIDIYLNKVVGLECDKGRKITLDVCTHPNMIRNHLILGFEEIRELPELTNDVAFRLIGKTCPTSILFCGCPDQWAPLSHMKELKELKSKSQISNIDCVYMESLTHDFVVHPEMIEPVVGFCLDQIKRPRLLSSKL